MQEKYNHLDIEKAAQHDWVARDAYRVGEDAFPTASTENSGVSR